LGIPRQPVGLELGYSHAEKVAALEATVAIASAVGFYTHLGMQILSESRVPFLEQYDIPAHYRMVKYL
jgi:hypothetical protein